MALLVPLSASPAALFVLMLLLGVAGMGIPPVGTGLAVRFAPAAPTLAAALAVSAFNGGTALGTWTGSIALGSPLGVTGPLVVAVAMAALGLVVLLIMAGLRLTKEPDRVG
jgi:DHA1 family inner membrane transport protein